MFKIKICGVTSVDDALAAVDAGADAIGLNFYAGSPRCVDVAVARTIGAALPGETDRVGVFVNTSAERIREVCDQAELNTIQLHGDQRPDNIKLLLGGPKITIVRGHRFGPRGLEGVYEDLFDADDSAADAVLVDAAAPGKYGGTGLTVDWSLLAHYEESLGQMPLILAGGLTPENVAEAIRIVRPHAVDVASGVESSPGKKDVAKMRRFVTAARQAFLRYP